MAETAEITQVLQAIGRSEEGAAEKLLPLVYAELRRLEDATARSEVDQARNLLEGGLNHGFDKWNWREWVFFRLLLREANALILQPPLPEPNSTPR